MAQGRTSDIYTYNEYIINTCRRLVKYKFLLKEDTL